MSIESKKYQVLQNLSQEEFLKRTKHFPHFAEVWERINSSIDDIPIPNLFERYEIINLSWSSHCLCIHLDIHKNGKISWSCAYPNGAQDFKSGNTIDELIPYFKLLNISIIMES